MNEESNDPTFQEFVVENYDRYLGQAFSLWIEQLSDVALTIAKKEFLERYAEESQEIDESDLELEGEL